MMAFILAATLLLATLTSSSVIQPPSDGTFELLILHNNDMHARFEQTSQLSGTCTTADRDAGKCYGGFPRVAHVVKEARKAAATGQGPPVLYLNAGDTYTGTVWFTLYKWKIAAEFINALQPDAISLGNNEFEKDTEEAPLLENVKTRILAANVIIHGETKIKLQKSTVFDINGVKVGVIGFITPDTSILEDSIKFEYINEVIALKEEAKKLKDSNVNIIIALGHSTMSTAEEIGKEVEDIDLVINGYKNDYLFNGAPQSEVNNVIKNAKVVTQEGGRNVSIFQSIAYNKFLGRIHLKFDTEGEVADYKEKPIFLDTGILQDIDSVKLLEKYTNELKAWRNEVIGETSVVLDGNTCKSEECNFGNLITDAIMYYYAVRFEGETWTDAPIAVMPGAAIAESIAPSNRPANVTNGDLITALPQENNLVALTINGTVLLQVLEHSVADYNVSSPTGQRLQVSGIRVVFDLEREPGNRVFSAVVRCWSCYVPQYYVIDDWRDYKILMPANIAGGELGYTMLADKPKQDLGYDAVTCISEFIDLRSPVYPEVAGRIVLENFVEPDLSDSVSDSATTISSKLILLVLALIPFLY